MASFRHSQYYDGIDAVRSSMGQDNGMRQVHPRDVPRGITPQHLVGNRRTSTFIRDPRTNALAERRVDEARGRANQNWNIASNAVQGASAFGDAAQRREKGRTPAGWGNPLNMASEVMLGTPRQVSPRSLRERKRATTASANKRGDSAIARDIRKRNEQDGLTPSRFGRKRAQNNMRQRHSLEDDFRTLSQQLRNTEGYYFGTMQDQYYQKMIEKAKGELGDSVSDERIQTLARQYYDRRYHPGRNQGSRSSSSSGSRSSSTSSRPSHGGPAPLSIPPEIRERSDHPKWFLGPITLSLMTDPVILSSGFTYERSAITAWLRTHKKDPVTNTKLKNFNLTPNMALRHSISAHITRMANTPVQQNKPNNKPNNKKTMKKKGKGRSGKGRSGKGGARNVKTRRRKKSRRKSRKRKSKKKKKKYK